MSPVDGTRIRLAAWWYGTWLEYHGVAIRRRRELKHELRANLVEASAASSARQAIRNLGGVRVLAGKVARESVARPRWQIGCVAAAWTFAIIIGLEAIAAGNYVNGVADSDGAAAAGSIWPFPGSFVAHDPTASGFAIEVGFGWFPFALAALVFMLVARPWRLLRRPAAHPRLGLGHD